MYKWFYLGGVLITIIMAVVVISNFISSGRIDSWLGRAKDAGNPAQASEFLLEYKTALYEADRVLGKYYTIWKYPASDMETYIRVVDGLAERAEALAIQNPSDESYQMGLINLEKDLGDIDARALSVWEASGGFIFIIILCLFGAFTLVGCIPIIEELV